MAKRSEKTVARSTETKKATRLEQVTEGSYRAYAHEGTSAILRRRTVLQFELDINQQELAEATRHLVDIKQRGKTLQAMAAGLTLALERR